MENEKTRRDQLIAIMVVISKLTGGSPMRFLPDAALMMAILEPEADPFCRLCQDIMFCYMTYGLTFEGDGSIFTIRLDPSKNFYISLCCVGGLKVMVMMRHEALDEQTTFPERPIYCPYRQNMTNVRLRDTRKPRTFVHGLEYLAIEAEQDRCYKTDTFPVLKKAAVLDLVDLLLHIIMEANPEKYARHAARTAHVPGRCPRCGAPMGGGGMADALCAACERRPD